MKPFACTVEEDLSAITLIGLGFTDGDVLCLFVSLCLFVCLFRGDLSLFIFRLLCICYHFFFTIFVLFLFFVYLLSLFYYLL